MPLFFDDRNCRAPFERAAGSRLSRVDHAGRAVSGVRSKSVTDDAVGDTIVVIDVNWAEAVYYFERSLAFVVAVGIDAHDVMAAIGRLRIGRNTTVRRVVAAQAEQRAEKAADTRISRLVSPSKYTSLLYDVLSHGNWHPDWMLQRLR